MTSNKIDVTVTASLDNDGNPQFSYVPPSPLTVNIAALLKGQKTKIKYKLVDNTGKGLKLVGAGFNNPFNSIIDAVTTAGDGSYLILEDSDESTGTASFHLNFNVDGSTLLLCSPDPQIINKQLG